MLSRVADSLYWMSRYLERAERTAKLVETRGRPAEIVFNEGRVTGFPIVLEPSAQLKTALKLRVPRDSSQFRALSRPAVNAVVRMRDRYRYLRVMTGDIGYQATGIRYD